MFRAKLFCDQSGTAPLRPRIGGPPGVPYENPEKPSRFLLGCAWVPACAFTVRAFLVTVRSPVPARAAISLFVDKGAPGAPLLSSWLFVVDKGEAASPLFGP